MDLQFLNRSDPKRHGKWCTLALPEPHWRRLCSFRCPPRYGHGTTFVSSLPERSTICTWPRHSLRLFADDCLIYRSIKSLLDHVALQKDLESLHRWGETWGLKFNVSKCNIMHLSRKSVLPTRFYTLGGEVITSVSESKYHGVTFSNNYGTCSSQWKSHISQSASKANQRLAFLRRNLGGSPYKLRELAYISLVRSTMEYCGAIWDTTVKEECDRLEIVQRRAARWARGAKGIISVTTLLKDLDWLPLADRRRHQRLGLFYKMINGQLQVPEHTVDIKRSKSQTRQSNSRIGPGQAFALMEGHHIENYPWVE